MSQCGKIAVLFVATMLGFVVPAAHANEAETAVKDVIEALAKDLSRGNLESLLAHFAEDAQIDSIAANGKVSKDRYRQAMADTFKKTVPLTKVEYRLLSVSLPDPTHAVVTGRLYFQGSNWKREGSQEWRLEKRDSTWLITNTTYTKLGKVEYQ